LLYDLLGTAKKMWQFAATATGFGGNGLTFGILGNRLVHHRAAVGLLFGANFVFRRTVHVHLRQPFRRETKNRPRRAFYFDHPGPHAKPTAR
jgi:hypothetical protein